MGWLKNYPVPEYQLGFLLIGLALHIWGESIVAFEVVLGARLLGGILIAVGVLVSVWSAMSFGEEAMASPNTLRTSGPYRFTRNPMYLSWFVVTLGLGLLLGSFWLVGSSFAAALVTQFREIAGEEKTLTKLFGEDYEMYRARTARWFWFI
jgi:protein-S-isoprenylcysteine O-methyltransferase Ste14